MRDGENRWLSLVSLSEILDSRMRIADSVLPEREGIQEA